MKKQITILFLLLTISNITLLAQTDLEEAFFSKIYTINSNIIDARKSKIPIKPILKRYEALTKEINGDNQLGAVVHARIGQSLTRKHYYKEAKSFFIKAYKYRKKQGDFFPQRWALKALINNELDRGDFKSAFKYSKTWVDLMKAHPEKLKELKEVYKYSSSLKKSVSKDINSIVKKFLFLKYSQYDRENYDVQKGRKYVPKLLKYYYKKLPVYQSETSLVARGFYELLTRILVENDYDELAFEAKNESLRFLKKNADPVHYAGYVKYISTWFRKSGKAINLGYTYETNGIKTTKHEAIGIELMEEYIRVNKEIAKENQVLFGYRYIATRYIILEDYQKAVQYLATAIKYCHAYKLEEETVKSIGGLKVMLEIIIENKDKNGLIAAKKWKDDFILKGLKKEDIQQIDKVLNDYSSINQILNK